jgi:hypothetical protein
MIVSSWIIFRIINISDKIGTECQTQVLCSKHCSENRAFYEKIWKKYGRGTQAKDDIIQRMSVACWVIKL